MVITKGFSILHSIAIVLYDNFQIVINDNLKKYRIFVSIKKSYYDRKRKI